MDYLTEVAEFAAGFPARKLPLEVAERTRLIIADCIGAIVGGAAEPEMRALSARMAGGGPSLVLGTLLTAQPGHAALLNGAAGTFLEMDEGNQFSKGHPGIHTVPAALAFAEAAGCAAPDLVAAVAVGYEVGARVGIASQLRPSMHPHGTWGAICAAVAVQRLAGADAKRMREALNIAANFGLSTSRRTMLEGGTVRNAFSGISGQMGVLAHEILEAGFCGEYNGVEQIFGKVVSDTFKPSAMTEGLGARWEVMRNYFKMHSCCRFNHAALDALAMIRAEHALDLGRIEAIEVESYSLAAELSDPRPRNVLAGKFSLPFAVATTLVNESTGVASFEAENLSNREILALAAKVRVSEDPLMTAQLPARRPARVTVRLPGGIRLTAETATNRGDWTDPYTPEEIRQKYLSLAARMWPADAARAVWDGVMGLGAGKVAKLGTLMREAAA